MTATDERALIRRARAGDRGAFRQIVEGHKGQVFSLALGLTRNHHDAEDLVQEVFLRAYQSLDRFRGDAQLATWLHRITVNAGLDARRRVAGKRNERLEDEVVHRHLVDLSPAADPERAAASQGIRRDIDRAVLGLSPAERSVFILRHGGQLSMQEIALTLGRAEGTVKNLLFRAIRKLRAKLADHLAQRTGTTRHKEGSS